tara:strand:- start:5863 stop:7830 length:1968 start_codon:yes stop_codon:yes gene_type:complete
MLKTVGTFSILISALNMAHAGECLGELVLSPKVNSEHFVEVSPYASPIEAFFSSALYGKSRPIESKYLAGIREKIQDHHTDSSLYRDIRSSLIDRGLYNTIKSTKELFDKEEARDFGIDILNDFYEQQAKNQKLSAFIDSPDRDEEFKGAYSPIDTDYQLVMNVNKCAVEKKNGDISYFGFIDNNEIQSVAIQKRSNSFSFHRISNGKNNFIAALKNPRGFMVCNDNLDFYKCGDRSMKPVSPGSLVGVLAQDTSLITQDIFDYFKDQSNDNSFLDLIEGDLERLEDQKLPVHVDYPFAKVVNGKPPLKLMNSDSKYDDVNEVIADDSSYFPTKVNEIIYTPTNKSDWDAEFKFKGEKKLVPGESVYLVLPKGFEARPLANVILGHRQNPKDQRGHASYRHGVKTYDQYPAYTSVQVHSVDLPYKDSWRTWGGPVSSDKGSKFAEIKKRPEFDNLYEWPLKGHKSLRTGKELKTPLRSNLIKLEVLGDDPVYIDSIIVKVVPPKSNNYVDLSFTRSRTSMGDPETFKGRRFGGGQRYGGRFPGSKRLSPYRGNPDQLFINLNGESIQAVNVAAGDTRPDGVRNRDGGTGSLGHARISIIVERMDGKRITLVDQENVAPQGVISGYASGKGIPAKSIIIEAYSDTAYIMGIQYGFN